MSLPGRSWITLKLMFAFMASRSCEGIPTTHASSEPSPAACLVLPPDTVHLWQLDLADTTEHSARLGPLLASGERQRAHSFSFARDRERFVVVRATLRRLLGSYLGRSPAHLVIREGVHGKPFVAETSLAGTRLCFNISHTDGLALLAFAWEHEIGVDVERVRPMPALEEIAQRFFAPAERATLAAMPVHQRLQGFFACWTRKEAYVKARGAGLTLPLDSFAVSMTPNEPASLLWVDVEPDARLRWRIEALAPRPGYLGALAMAGSNWSLEARGDAMQWLT